MVNTNSFSSNVKSNFTSWFSNNKLSITTLILLVGLVAFEMFNYSTTDYALKDLLGDLKFVGFYWSTILAIAFCLIDFAGISKLFMPGNTISDLKEDWFLFGAWFLAATMNAILTWWGVSLSIVNHSILSSRIVDPETINLVVPLFVAIMVWITRILLIGSLTLSGQNSQPNRHSRPINRGNQKPVTNHVPNYGSTLTARSSSTRPVSRMANSQASSRLKTHPEPEYISDPMTNQQPAFHKGNRNNITARRF
ncbi:MAG TPA: hypothetical protein VK856_14890 [Anaerolineaceae bacterium]|nr:hypothetical protein [Anaerolineaceae bacterium]